MVPGEPPLVWSAGLRHGSFQAADQRAGPEAGAPIQTRGVRHLLQSAISSNVPAISHLIFRVPTLQKQLCLLIASLVQIMP